MPTAIQARGTISVPLKDGEGTFEFPVGEDLQHTVEDLYSPERFAPSTMVKRFAAKNDVDLRDVLDTLLGEEDLGSLTVKRFLTNTGLRPLFSPVVEDGLRLGLQRAQAQWEALIARTVPVDSMTYEYYEFDNGTPGSPEPSGTSEFQLKSVGQGAPIPTARVTVSGKSYTLYKKGRGIEWTDESKEAPIDLADLWFQQVGLQLGWDYHNEIVDMLLNGYFDDGSDDAPVIPNGGGAGSITDQDLLGAVATMQTVYGYTANVQIMDQATALKIQTMENAGGTYRIFPDGVEAAGLPRIIISPKMPANKILFVDTNFAMIRFVNKPFGTEFDRSVQTQVEGSYGTEISLTVPFQKYARVILDATS